MFEKSNKKLRVDSMAYLLRASSGFDSRWEYQKNHIFCGFLLFLGQKSGILHRSMACIMNGRNKTVTLSTIYMLARGFDMSIIEFLNN